MVVLPVYCVKAETVTIAPFTYYSHNCNSGLVEFPKNVKPTTVTVNYDGGCSPKPYTYATATFSFYDKDKNKMSNSQSWCKNDGAVSTYTLQVPSNAAYYSYSVTNATTSGSSLTTFGFSIQGEFTPSKQLLLNGSIYTKGGFCKTADYRISGTGNWTMILNDGPDGNWRISKLDGNSFSTNGTISGTEGHTQSSKTNFSVTSITTFEDKISIIGEINVSASDTYSHASSSGKNTFTLVLEPKNGQIVSSLNGNSCNGGSWTKDTSSDCCEGNFKITLIEDSFHNAFPLKGPQISSNLTN